MKGDNQQSEEEARRGSFCLLQRALHNSLHYRKACLCEQHYFLSHYLRQTNLELVQEWFYVFHFLTFRVKSLCSKPQGLVSTI